MTHEELRECLRKAQEYQTAAFAAKKVTVNVDSHYFHVTNDYGITINVFYGENNELFQMSLNASTKPEDARIKFAIVDAIFCASDEYISNKSE